MTGGGSGAAARLSWSPFDLAVRLAGFFATWALVLPGYGLAKLEPFARARQLPLTSLDRAIPFLPWTVWAYGTVTAATLVAWLSVPDRLRARRLLLAMVTAAALCWLCFLVFPTTYPRALYPLPPPGAAGVSLATLREFAQLRERDSPSNCLPSMHVALAWALALTWREALAPRALLRALPLAWAAVVSVSTLTTKQHYVVDVPAGALAGALGWYAARRAVRADAPPFWARFGRPLALARAEDAAQVAALRRKVEAHQWSLDELPWAQGDAGAAATTEASRPLPPLMVRLINQVIYIEEIAGLNFALLRDASADADLRAVYDRFADEERRHADGLRRMLALRGGRLEPPGLGNALVLHQFDTLDPRSDADALLVALSTPVFETFLDAGTIPFLRAHPALRGDLFAEFERRVSRDEAVHLAVNWLVARHAARAPGSRLRALRWMLNPAIYRGVLAVPFMSLEVYALAYRLGYDFRTLLPAFGRLWRLHRRYPELRGFPLWWLYRLFVACGAVAAVAVIALDRVGLVFGWFWTSVTRATDLLALALFGPGLLARRGLPATNWPLPRRLRG